jgi:hypothetical protein
MSVVLLGVLRFEMNVVFVLNDRLQAVLIAMDWSFRDGMLIYKTNNKSMMPRMFESSLLRAFFIYI